MNVNPELTSTQRNHDRRTLLYRRPEADRSTARPEVSSCNVLGRKRSFSSFGDCEGHHLHLRERITRGYLSHYELCRIFVLWYPNIQ